MIWELAVIAKSLLTKIFKMEEVKFYTMQEYCNNIKKYFELYHKDESNIELYGDAIQKLKILMTTIIDETEFIVRIEELIGDTTRVLQGSYSDIPFLSWIGNEKESFTKEHFLNTMKNVWFDL